MLIYCETCNSAFVFTWKPNIEKWANNREKIKYAEMKLKFTFTIFHAFPCCPIAFASIPGCHTRIFFCIQISHLHEKIFSHTKKKIEFHLKKKVSILWILTFGRRQPWSEHHGSEHYDRIQFYSSFYGRKTWKKIFKRERNGKKTWKECSSAIPIRRIQLGQLGLERRFQFTAIPWYLEFLFR